MEGKRKVVINKNAYIEWDWMNNEWTKEVYISRKIKMKNKKDIRKKEKEVNIPWIQSVIMKTKEKSIIQYSLYILCHPYNHINTSSYSL